MFRLLPLFVWALLAGPVGAQGLPWSKWFSTAPRGSLIIVGGGDTPLAVQERFVALAGGPGKARIAVFPMASQASDEEAREVIVDLRKLGADPELVDIGADEAGSETVTRRLETYTGYWFAGGDQTRLADLLVGSLALATIERRYREGAVVGGTSAGAAVMSSVMLTGQWRETADADKARTLNIVRRVKGVAPGFGFLRDAIVDQHFMHRARYNRLISAVLDHPELIGVGIDEETALLVRPDGEWEVLGNYYVKLFDARAAQIVDDAGPMAKASDIRMHVLPEGALFNPKKRKVAFQPG